MQELEITAEAQLWHWLDAHHAQPDSVKLVTYKAATPSKYVGREAVLDALVAYGWIDGRRFVVDDARTAQLIAPRKQQAWSQSYKDRAEALRKDGRMHPAGEAAIEASKHAGLWDFFADVDALIVAPDLAEALGGLSTWECYAPSYRRNVLRWIKLAKTAPTRAKRIAAAAEATAKGDELPQM